MDEAQPWWTGPRVVIWTVGPVTAAFFILLAVFFGWVPSPMLTGIQTSADALVKQESAVVGIRGDLTSHMRTDETQQSGLMRALRQICRNTAKTPQQNEKCDEM